MADSVRRVRYSLSRYAGGDLSVVLSLGFRAVLGSRIDNSQCFYPSNSFPERSRHYLPVGSECRHLWGRVRCRLLFQNIFHHYRYDEFFLFCSIKRRIKSSIFCWLSLMVIPMTNIDLLIWAIKSLSPSNFLILLISVLMGDCRSSAFRIRRRLKFAMEKQIKPNFSGWLLMLFWINFFNRVSFGRSVSIL